MGTNILYSIVKGLGIGSISFLGGLCIVSTYELYKDSERLSTEAHIDYERTHESSNNTLTECTREVELQLNKLGFHPDSEKVQKSCNTGLRSYSLETVARIGTNDYLRKVAKYYPLHIAQTNCEGKIYDEIGGSNIDFGTRARVCIDTNNYKQIRFDDEYLYSLDIRKAKEEYEKLSEK